MRTILALACCCLLPVHAEDVDRHTFCESCLAVAKEIGEALRDVPAGGRRAAVEDLIGGGACEKLLTEKHERFSGDGLASSCLSLLESYRDRFRAALIDPPERPEISLCYEQTPACTGVKRRSFQDSEATFTESHLDALLVENEENVRVARPVRPGSAVHAKNEL